MSRAADRRRGDIHAGRLRPGRRRHHPAPLADRASAWLFCSSPMPSAKPCRAATRSSCYIVDTVQAGRPDEVVANPNRVDPDDLVAATRRPPTPIVRPRHRTAVITARSPGRTASDPVLHGYPGPLPHQHRFDVVRCLADGLGPGKTSTSRAGQRADAATTTRHIAPERRTVYGCPDHAPTAGAGHSKRPNSLHLVRRCDTRSQRHSQASLENAADLRFRVEPRGLEPLTPTLPVR